MKLNNYELHTDVCKNKDGFNVCGSVLTSYFNNDLGIARYKGSTAYTDGALYSHMYQFPYVFHGKDEEQVYFGLELEYNYLHNSIKSFSTFRKENRREDNTFMVFKGDGSLRSGIEMNTQPFSIGWYNSRGKQMITDYVTDATKYGATADSNCGIHVHISRSIGEKAYNFIRDYVCANKQLFEKIGGRPENSYCLYQKDNMKYRAVAFHKVHTIELRFMASSTDPVKVLGRVELAMALVHFARASKATQDKGFVEFVKSFEKGFTNLKTLL